MQQDSLVQEDKGRTEVAGVVVAAVEGVEVAVVAAMVVVEVAVVAAMVVVEELLVHKPGLAPMPRTASMTGQTMWCLIARSSQFSPQ